MHCGEVVRFLTLSADSYGTANVDMLGRDGAQHAYVELNAFDNPNQLRVTWKREHDGGPVRPQHNFARMNAK